MSLLFEAEMREVDASELARERQEMGKLNPDLGEVSTFARELVEGVAAHRERIDSAISDHLDGWVLERLPAVDRAILRVGGYELLFGQEQTEAATVIDQAVLLTSELAAEKSIGYVNAVLDRIAGLADHIRAAEAAVSALDGAAVTAPETDAAPDATDAAPAAADAGAAPDEQRPDSQPGQEGRTVTD